MQTVPVKAGIHKKILIKDKGAEKYEVKVFKGLNHSVSKDQ